MPALNAFKALRNTNIGGVARRRGETFRHANTDEMKALVASGWLTAEFSLDEPLVHDYPVYTQVLTFGAPPAPAPEPAPEPEVAAPVEVIAEVEEVSAPIVEEEVSAPTTKQALSNKKR
jgi:hypothetical protein